jgi:hypothetical protein
MPGEPSASAQPLDMTNRAYTATVCPGLYKFSESRPRLARDLTCFEADLARQVRSGARWQLVTRMAYT